mgnify:CR=1 FL=1|jgi:hypothetical protein
MYERMLNKQEVPTVADMTAFCGENAELFTLLNDWLFEVYGTERQVVFPYGNKYGWGMAHKMKKKLVCNVFPESNAYTVMIRLSDKQYESVYGNLQQYTQEYIDNKYPCGDGGWIHYRVTCRENFEDIQKILSIKCS